MDLATLGLMRGTTGSMTDSMVGCVVEERYQIEEELGRGAMGTVYRARHIKLGREVAIKMLHDHLVTDEAMVARFEREAALAARLDHVNVVSVIDVGDKMMVLELARGETLAAIVGRGPMAGARVIELTTQLLRGLEHAHAMGLVHRDLKPENVIVQLDDYGHEVPRIVDFGIAVLRTGSDEDGGRRITEHGLVLGTPAYMAPEQAHGDAPDPRTDLFALGVMVYEMLAGKQPFDGTGVEMIIQNIGTEPPAILRRARVEVDPLLEAFARKLMARKVADRFASAPAALDMLSMIAVNRAAASRMLELRARPRIALPAIVAAVAEPIAPVGTVPMPTAPRPPVDAVAATHRWTPDMPIAVVLPARDPAPIARWAAALAVILLGVVIGWRAARPRPEAQLVQLELPSSETVLEIEVRSP